MLWRSYHTLSNGIDILLRDLRGVASDATMTSACCRSIGTLDSRHGYRYESMLLSNPLPHLSLLWAASIVEVCKPSWHIQKTHGQASSMGCLCQRILHVCVR